MKLEIPVMFCFDNNYVIPAAVAFYSLLEHANQNYHYKFYVLHSDITYENQAKLKETIKEFTSFSSLEFIDMTNRFEDLWIKIKTKGHFSKEVMYKVLVASIFPQYEKIIVSDVDVIFLNDISESYINFNTNDDVYLAGVKGVGKIMHYMENYKPAFTDEEIEKLSGFCGGYIIFNLKKLREDNMEEKFIKCFEVEGHRINQMEQDVLNLCCYPKTKKLPLNYVTCSYMWDLYQTNEDFKNDLNYSEKELKNAVEHPIQLHYATSVKPWNVVDCTKSEEWYKYLVKTPFLRNFLVELSIKSSKEKNVNKKDKLIRYIKIVTNYIKRNPSFLIKKKFYKKVYKKLLRKIGKEQSTNISLLILDDCFPSIDSPFRFAEFMGYFGNIDDVEAILVSNNGISSKINEKQEKSLKEFISANPEFANKIKTGFDYNKKVNLAITVFLNNTYANLNFFEENEIPFIFTLYPGGGFALNDKESDDKLSKVIGSSYFRKVITNEKIIYDYLINTKICNPEKIAYIPGGIIINKMLKQNKTTKKRFGFEKQVLDICFVAHKYSPNGQDKGYDIFIKTAKILAKKYDNIRFHVVGEFTEKDIDVKELKEKITFYGVKKIDWFKKFYTDKDIIVSPNIPFVLSKGSFDGFPTTSSLEAMLNYVTLICTDELKSNIFFEDNNDLLLVKHDANDIAKKINYYYKHPKELASIAKNGHNTVKKYYLYKKQIMPRVKLVEQLIKKEKKR